MGFYNDVLPDDGNLYVVTKSKSGKTKHYKVSSPDELERRAQELSQFTDVYFALAAYSDPIKTEEGSTKWRTHDQVIALRSLWLDLDCKDGLYKSKKQALLATKALCKALKIPLPYIVDSGGGLHVYWPLTSSVPPSEWKPVSQLFRAIRRKLGFKSDPVRECDESSILRPPGTLNYKYTPARPVVLLTPEAKAWHLSRWMDHLGRLAKSLRVEVTAPRRAVARNDDLTHSQYDDLPVDAGIIAEKCQQVRLMRDSGGDVSEPHWRLVIGLLKFCEDGLAIAHEWSKGSDRYDPKALEDRWNRWTVGPPTCEAFDQQGDGTCQGCPFKVTTPVQLGQKPPVEPPPPPVEVKERPEAKPKTFKRPPMPRGFSYRDGAMIRWVDRGERGGLVPKRFCYDELHVVKRIRSESGAMCKIVALATGPSGKRFLKTADVPLSLIASGGPEFKKLLGEHEIMATPDKDSWNHLQAFLQEELQRLQKAEEAIPVFETFGWHDSMFALGPRLYMDGGHVRSAAYLGAPEEKKHYLAPVHDSPEEWAEAVNWIYNRQGMEPIQYAIACSFGSVLGKFQPEIYRGIPLSLVGTGSGRGKTTGCLVATSVYAQSDIAFVNSTLGATINARNALMSMMQNLPLLIDEVTHIQVDDLSKLLYAVSNGMDRLRMDMRGTGSIKLSQPLRWNLVTFLTSNAPLVDILSSARKNLTPELMRIVEVNVDEHPLPILDVREMEKRLETITKTAGSAGHLYMKHVVDRQDKLRKAVTRANDLLLKDLPFLGQGEYRFWRFQAACALVGINVAKTLGLVDFDLAELYKWLVGFFNQHQQQLLPSTVTNFEEVLNSFLLSLNGRAITTLDYPTGNRQQSIMDDSVPRPNREVVARVVLADTKYNNTVFVLESYFNRWCSEHRVDRPAFMQWMRDKGILKTVARLNIAKGTPIPAVSSRVLRITLSTADAALRGIYGIDTKASKSRTAPQRAP